MLIDCSLCPGDLLYKISGVSGKMTTETASEDDNFGTEQGQKIITRMLGVDRRNRVLAGQLYCTAERFWVRHSQ